MRCFPSDVSDREDSAMIQKGARAYLWSAWKKRSRKDNNNENAAWADAAYFGGSDNLGKAFSGE